MVTTRSGKQLKVNTNTKKQKRLRKRELRTSVTSSTTNSSASIKRLKQKVKKLQREVHIKIAGEIKELNEYITLQAENLWCVVRDLDLKIERLEKKTKVSALSLIVYLTYSHCCDGVPPCHSNSLLIELTVGTNPYPVNHLH